MGSRRTTVGRSSRRPCGPLAIRCGFPDPIPDPIRGIETLKKPSPDLITPPADARARRPHLYGIDLMRIIAVIGVIALHSVTLVDSSTSLAANGLLVVLHASRELFFALTALVLVYNDRPSPDRWHGLLRFWRRRYWLVVTPYVVWSAIYFVANGSRLSPFANTLLAFGRDLLTGGARYHLYFLLVSMQLYLVFPLLKALLRRTRGHHAWLLAISVAVQLVFAGAVHAQLALPGPLGFWVRNPDSLLPSYVAFIVAGALIAEHLEMLSAWVRRWWALAVLGALAGIALAGSTYFLQVERLGEAPSLAAAVFQPVLVVESLGVILGMFAVGEGWASLRRPRWLAALISDGASSSFGIYLAHPLVLQALIVVATANGAVATLTAKRERVVALTALLVVTPAVLIATWLLVSVLRLSPLSIALTGRTWARRDRRRAATRGTTVRRQAIWGGGASMIGLSMLVALVFVTQVVLDAPAQHALAADGVPAPTKTALPQPTPSATPKPAPGITVSDVNVTAGGAARAYQVLAPADPASSSLPVIVFLHGLDATIQLEEGRDGLTPQVVAGNAILVYPIAENEEWNDGEGGRSAGVDDVGFLTAVIQQAAKLPNADPTRVFLAGFSRGGRMAYRIVCQNPSLVAGVTIIAALPDNTCGSSGAPLSLLQMGGTLDSQVPYTQVQDEVATWAARDSCKATPSRNAASPAITTYAGCAERTSVQLATYQGGTHVWPGGNGEALPGPIVWAFFSALPGRG
ncbi:MAG: acyltransferase family protein [Candidatus Dormiibacterota bacterium]